MKKEKVKILIRDMNDGQKVADIISKFLADVVEITIYNQKEELCSKYDFLFISAQEAIFVEQSILDFKKKYATENAIVIAMSKNSHFLELCINLCDACIEKSKLFYTIESPSAKDFLKKISTRESITDHPFLWTKPIHKTHSLPYYHTNELRRKKNKRPVVLFVLYFILANLLILGCYPGRYLDILASILHFFRTL